MIQLVKENKNYYPKVFLEECEYVVKKRMPDHITNDIGLSSDEENSGEENFNEEN